MQKLMKNTFELRSSNTQPSTLSSSYLLSRRCKALELCVLAAHIMVILEDYRDQLGLHLPFDLLLTTNRAPCVICAVALVK